MFQWAYDINIIQGVENRCNITMNILVKEEVKLAMVEGITMPVRALNKATKEWEKTGETEQVYQYSFIGQDGFAEKIVFMINPKFLDLRDKDGKVGTLILELKQKEFQGKRTNALSVVAFDAKK